MRKDKDIATKMRQDGMSYKAIRSRLHIPLSTLSEWFSGDEWSREVKTRLKAQNVKEGGERLRDLATIRGIQLRKIYAEAEREAAEEFEYLKYNPLFIAGIMLYWGEGDKVDRGHVRLANSEAGIIRLYITFLDSVFKIDRKRIRAWLLLYPDLDEATCIKFWRTEGGLGDLQFTKTQVIKGKSSRRKLSHGVCYVNFQSSFFKRKMLAWTQLLQRELVGNK